MAEDGYYTAQEAASKLRLHKGSLLRALRDNTIALQTYEAPDRRTHRKFFFRVDEVDRLAERRAKLRRVR